MGVAQISLGNLPAARDRLLEAIEHWPDFAVYHANLTWCYAAMGDFVEAINSLARAMELERYRPDWFHWLGQLYEKNGEPHIARLQYERARYLGYPSADKAIAGLPPESPGQWYDSGRRSVQAGATDAAKLCYERALRLGDKRARSALGRLSHLIK